jgi:N-acyl-D-amino-acid deacylase
MRLLTGSLTIITFVCAAQYLVAEEVADPVRDAVGKSLPLLQKVGPTFWAGAGCISCHNNTLPDLAVSIARERGFPVNETAVKRAQKLTFDFLDARRERLLEGLPPGGGQNTMSSLLFTMSLEHVPPDETMEAGARYMKVLQADDGSWPVLNHRPPLVSSTMGITAMTVKGLMTYAPASQKDEYGESIRKAVDWLTKSAPRTNEESIFKVLGLCWGNGPKSVIAETTASLVSQQRDDGGWSQLSFLPSDAYATGQALFALHESGMKTADPVYQKGVQFLVRTQNADGSWHVKTRSDPTQIYFEAGYPYGTDQFISAAGGSWATAALALTQKR